MRSYFCVLLLSLGAACAAELPSGAPEKIDKAVKKALAETAAPSASIAVVRNGEIAYVKAYGNARLEPVTAARPEMRYSIGSVSKQFLAGAVLLLAQDGKLSLDETISSYLPNLTRAKEITIRELLTHTSGYQDYYALDYVAPYMLKPVTAEDILNEWARKPLDFDPGTRWQYSNTNYVAVGRIVEQVADMPLMSFLEKRIFQPLGMQTPIDLAGRPMTEADAAGYTRFGLGPLRPAPEEGRGWLFAAGELAMTARDLALWDISLIEHRLLKPASLQAMMSCVRLADGAPVNYGLGVGVGNVQDHPRLQHGGAVSGFVSENTVWPDERAAVVAFTNLDGSDAPAAITRDITPLLITEAEDPQAAQALEQARQIFTGLQEGRLERTLLTSDANAFFTAQVLADAAASLKPLGAPRDFRQTSVSLRGGMTYRHFRIEFKDQALHLSTFTTPDGKLDQYLIQ